ncbi:MAG: nuclear transport factor 2 family protein [Spirochaetales bacterium]|nr:nuclear transport factor 2 family protein [Spirochaetales bacterium]
MNMSLPKNYESSPRLDFLKEFNQAFAEGNIHAVLQALSSDVEWHMVGEKLLQGKEEVRQELQSNAEFSPDKVKMYSFISHGKNGAANGKLFFPGGKEMEFCDIYEFSNETGTMLQSIRSYIVSIRA